MPLFIATYNTRQQGKTAYHTETVSAPCKRVAVETLHNKVRNITKGIRIREVKK